MVDDEPDVEVTIRQRFRPQVRRGVYEFFFAQNGAAALQVLREHDDIDVVLSDINMPEMDGLAFLANARAMNPVRRVVMVSAYGDVANIRTAMNREAFEFVLKPIDFADLEATIKKAVAELAVLREALRRWTEAERARATGLDFKDATWTFSGKVKIDVEGGTMRAEEAVVNFVADQLARATVRGKPAEFEQQMKTGGKARGRAGSLVYETRGGTVTL